MSNPVKRGRPRKENLLEGLVNLDAKAPAQEIPATPKHVAGKNLTVTTAELVFWTGYSGAQLSDLKSQGIVTPKSQGVWPALPTMSALLKRLKNRQNGEDTSEDKARKLKAEANSAELKALEAGRETCLMIHAKQYWSDSRIAMRQTIERAEYISAAHREMLLREIAAMKPAKLQQGNADETEDQDEE